MVLNDAFVGFCLGADYCAEHEWGIEGLKRSLALNENEIGIKARCINMAHGLGDKVVLLENKKYLLIICDSWWNKEENNIEKFLKCNSGGELKSLADRNGFGGAWSERDFALLVRKSNMLQTEEQKTYEGFARELFKAFENNDICLLFSRSLPVFENAGLCLCITSRVPQESKDALEAADLDNLALTEAAEKTGIKAKIDAANKEKGFDAPFRYFALSPRWKGDENTKHPVVFWLNPMQQDRNYWGIVTVEDLEDWLEGKGKIPKDRKKAG
jgi:hypothetical protein